jgi:hypothetical protein
MSPIPSGTGDINPKRSVAHSLLTLNLTRKAVRSGIALRWQDAGLCHAPTSDLADDLGFDCISKMLTLAHWHQERPRSPDHAVPIIKVQVFDSQ